MSISAIKLDLAFNLLAYMPLRPIRPDLALDCACMGGRGCGLQGKEGQRGIPYERRMLWPPETRDPHHIWGRIASEQELNNYED